MIEPRHLRVLQVVAQAGSFTAAARELRCTQPAVSQQIKALEKSVGTPILARSGRNAFLTEAGEILARHAAAVLTRLTAAEEEIAAIAGLHAGRVRLVSFLSGTSTVVPPALATVRAAQPEVEVTLNEATPPRAIDMLRNGDCDIALAFRYPQPPGAHPDTPDAERAAGTDWNGLVVHPLLTDRLVGLLPESHRLADAGKLELTDLADETWIVGCASCRGHVVKLCERSGFTPRIDLATDDYPTVMGLVGAGMGVAVLPELALSSMRSEAIRLAPIVPTIERAVVALTLPAYESVPAIRLMLQHLGNAARP
ncbi:LysR family transcriptional regulator [Streptomyces halobius]|uniref:LysR family transcriptional regulator n=1 Tax=Streptomyces halobius TaxID=2879846 RepID=A0ABY4M3V1_9ACTN|nr:LysR family transcriptional regulator [Streptomyces halobius]UQA92137.1 LysR family transcriptional regulator [Streptomyces halobius]